MDKTYTCENCGALESLSGCLQCSQCGVFSKCFETFDTLKAENARLRAGHERIANIKAHSEYDWELCFTEARDAAHKALKGGSDGA